MTNNIIQSTAFLLGAVVVVLTGGAASVNAQGAPAKLRACDFVDTPALEAIVGKRLSLLHNIESDELTICEISELGPGKVQPVTVAVTWKGGKKQAATEKVSMAMAKALLNDRDTDIEKITGSGSVPGLADAAFYSDVMPSWLLKGDVMVKVVAPTLSADKTKQVFLMVAKLALAKLPK